MRKSVFSVAAAVVVAAVIAFATPSSAQFALGGTTIDQVSAVPYGGVTTFAKELFGDGSSDTIITVDGSTNLTLTGDFSASQNNIASGKQATFTFTLGDGVQFGAPVTPLEYSGTSTDIRVTGTGGTKGDNSVSYMVTVADGATINTASTVFTFNIPKLQNAAYLGNADAVGPDNTAGTGDDVPPHIRMTVRVTPGGDRFSSPANSFPAFPAMGETDANANVRVIARSQTHFPLLLGPPTTPPNSVRTANIDIEDRSKLTPGGEVVTVTGPNFGDDGRQALRIATLDINEVAGANDADASTVPSLEAASGDRVAITAEGPFMPGDILFLSSDAVLTTGTTADTVLTPIGTTATSTASLDTLSDGTVRTLYLVPAADATRLNRGLYTATFTVNFAAEGMRGASANSPGVMLEYSGLSPQGYAYALPNPMAADVGRLRLTCESSSPCSAFLDCRGEDGREVGNFAEVSIMPRATVILNTRDMDGPRSLTGMLGDEEWTGRLACEILSNGNLGVQILTRSGGTLVNNTYISGTEATSTP